jgi:hypothetical protein
MSGYLLLLGMILVTSGVVIAAARFTARHLPRRRSGLG